MAHDPIARFQDLSRIAAGKLGAEAAALLQPMHDVLTRTLDSAALRASAPEHRAALDGLKSHLDLHVSDALSTVSAVGTGDDGAVRRMRSAIRRQTGYIWLSAEVWDDDNSKLEPRWSPFECPVLKGSPEDRAIRVSERADQMIREPTDHWQILLEYTLADYSQCISVADERTRMLLLDQVDALDEKLCEFWRADDEAHRSRREGGEVPRALISRLMDNRMEARALVERAAEAVVDATWGTVYPCQERPALVGVVIAGGRERQDSALVEGVLHMVREIMGRVALVTSPDADRCADVEYSCWHSSYTDFVRASTDVSAAAEFRGCLPVTAQLLRHPLKAMVLISDDTATAAGDYGGLEQEIVAQCGKRGVAVYRARREEFVAADARGHGFRSALTTGDPSAWRPYEPEYWKPTGEVAVVTGPGPDGPDSVFGRLPIARLEMPAHVVSPADAQATEARRPDTPPQGLSL